MTPFSETAAPEAVGRADQPVDHEPAVAQAQHAEPLGSARPSPTTWSIAAWTSSASTPPQSPSCGADPVAAVRGRAADVRQHDPEAAIDEEHHLDRRRRRPRPERPAVDVDDGRQRRVAGAGAARRSTSRSAPPDPGACDELASPATGSGAASASRSRSASRNAPRSTVNSSGARAAERAPATVTAPPPTATADRRGVGVAPASGSAAGRRPALRGSSTVNGHGTRPAAVGDDRDDRLAVEPGRAGPALDHPAGQVGVVPVADRPVEVRRERPARRRAVGRADEARSGSGRRERPGRPTPTPRASGRPARTPGGSPSRRARGARAAPRPSPRLAVGRVRVDRPDRRPRREVRVGPRSAANAIVRPSGCHAMPATPKSPSVSCRAPVGPVAATTNRCAQRSR